LEFADPKKIWNDKKGRNLRSLWLARCSHGYGMGWCGLYGRKWWEIPSDRWWEIHQIIGSYVICNLAPLHSICLRICGLALFAQVLQPNLAQLLLQNVY